MGAVTARHQGLGCARQGQAPYAELLAALGVVRRHGPRSCTRGPGEAPFRWVGYTWGVTTEMPTAVQHPGPPAERPLSGLAVLGLILALASCVLTMLFWWVPLAALAVCLFVLFRQPAQRYRGRVLAMLGVALALLAAGCSVLMGDMVESALVRTAHGVLAGLSAEDADTGKARVASWVDARALEQGFVERVRARFDAAVAAYGPYTPPPVANMGLSGLRSLTVAPEGATELGPPPTGAGGSAAPPNAMWVRARFGTTQVHVAMEITHDIGGMVGASKKSAGGDATIPWLSDVRLFVVAPQR